LALGSADLFGIKKPAGPLLKAVSIPRAHASHSRYTTGGSTRTGSRLKQKWPQGITAILFCALVILDDFM